MRIPFFKILLLDRKKNNFKKHASDFNIVVPFVTKKCFPNI